MNFKTLITIGFIFSLNIAFAGGQIGSGANGCWIKNGNQIEWRTIEELAYPEHIHKFNMDYKKPRLPLRNYSTLSTINLSRIANKTNPFRKLERIKNHSPNVYKALMNLTKLFNFSYVFQGNIDGIYDGDRSQVFKKCISMSPAIITNEDGMIIFFAYTWNRIDNYSVEIILIHETLRFAQLFHPAFKDFTNSDLQLVTALLFSEKKIDFRIRNLLQSYESKIKQGCSLPVGSTFKSRIQHDICFGKNLDYLNAWRSTNQDYRDYVEAKIRDMLRLGTP